METEELKRFRQEYETEELREWFGSLLLEYEKWAGFQTEWRKIRNQSIKSLQFPYEYREGQRELVT